MEFVLIVRSQRFYAILVAHIRYACKQTTQRIDEQTNAAKAKAKTKAATAGTEQPLPLLLESQNLVVGPLFELSALMPKFAGAFHRKHLTELREAVMSRASAEDSDNADDDNSEAKEKEKEAKKQKGKANNTSALPTADELLYLKLLSAIFPVRGCADDVLMLPADVRLPAQHHDPRAAADGRERHSPAHSRPSRRLRGAVCVHAAAALRVAQQARGAGVAVVLPFHAGQRLRPSHARAVQRQTG